MAGPTATPPGSGEAGTYYFLDRQIAADAVAYRGVFSGCAVTQQSTPDMTVQVGQGTFHQLTVDTPELTFDGATLTIAPAHEYLYRIDLITLYGGDSVLEIGPTARVTTGASEGPTPPAIPTSADYGIDIVLALIVVPPWATTMLDEYIYDRRAMLPFRLMNFGGSTTLAMVNALNPPVAGYLASGGNIGIEDGLIETAVMQMMPAMRVVRLAADVSKSTTTGLAVTGMGFSAVLVGTHLVVYALRYRSDTAGTGARYGINHTGTATVLYNSIVPGSSTGAHNQDAAVTSLAGVAARAGSTTVLPLHSVSVDTANADMLLWLFALIDVTADGTLELWFASEGGGTITTKAGSGALLVKLGS